MILAKFSRPCKDFGEVRSEIQHYIRLCEQKYPKRTWGLLFQVKTYEDYAGLRLEGAVFDKAGQIAFNQLIANQTVEDLVEILS